MNHEATARKAPEGWPEPPPPEICPRCGEPVWPEPYKSCGERRWIVGGMHEECMKAEETEKKKQLRQAEIMAATLEANLPAGLGQWDFERAWREASAIKQGEDFELWAKAWHECKGWLGGSKGLFLRGSAGVGKTVLLCCALGEAMRLHGHSGIYVHAPSLARDAGKSLAAGSRARTVMEAVEKRHYVVLDDLGVSKTGVALSRFFSEVIDERMRRGLPLLVGTNAGPKEMGANLNDRKYGRVWSRLRRFCVSVKVKGLAFDSLTAEGEW